MPAIGSATNQSVSSEDLGGGNHGQDLRVGREILAPAQRGRRPLLLTPSSLYSVFACLCFNTHTHTQTTKSKSYRHRDVYDRAQPVLRVQLQSLVRVLRGRLRRGLHEETFLLHRRHPAGWRGGEHPRIFCSRGAHGTPPSPPPSPAAACAAATAAAAALGHFTAAPFARGAGRVSVRCAVESGISVPQTRTTVDLSVQNCF